MNPLSEHFPFSWNTILYWPGVSFFFPPKYSFNKQLSLPGPFLHATLPDGGFKGWKSISYVRNIVR